MPPLRTCLGALRQSNVQAFPGNKFRSGLGIGMSKETKKTPQFIYKPGVGLVQIGCCELPPLPPPSITQIFTTPNNITSGSINTAGIPISYQLPFINPAFVWSAFITVTGGHGTPVTATKIYPGGKFLYIYVGSAGIVIPPVPPFFPNPTYLPGGASGVYEDYALIQFIVQSFNLVAISLGGTSSNTAEVKLVLTAIPA